MSTTNKFDIRNVRIASPCSVGWQNMSGDERTRHCQKCNLNVYNISSLTAPEVENLILSRDGRLCIRMYRRADGTILTKDCPVGLRAVRKRLTRLAGATLATVLGLFSVSLAQKAGNHAVDAPPVKIVRMQTEDRDSKMTGTLTDPNGAVISGAQVLLTGGDQTIKAISDSEGVYDLVILKSGIYNLKVTSSGFEEYTLKDLLVGANEKLTLNVELRVNGGEVVGELIVEPSLVESTPSILHTVILSPRKIEKPN